jgi:hypothetical protein
MATAKLSPPAQSYLQMLALPRHDAAAVLGVCAFAALAFSASALVGLSFNSPLHLMVLMPVTAALLAFVYHLWRPRENQLFQILVYTALWSLLPTAGTQLTYLASTANMPLQTDLFVAADRAIGFSWIDWANFILAHSWLESVTGSAYLSYAFQPYVALVLVALFGTVRRNAQLMIATMIALAITIIVSALIPAIEPATAYGFKTPAWETHEALRAGQRTGLPYVGIICFPSFHTAMAVLFTAVYRGMPWAFWPAAALNAVMLLSVPFSGDHYLIDLFGGLAVALIAIKLTVRLVPEDALR